MPPKFLRIVTKNDYPVNLWLVVPDATTIQDCG
jgi:hypothetical protein